MSSLSQKLVAKYRNHVLQLWAQPNAGQPHQMIIFSVNLVFLFMLAKVVPVHQWNSEMQCRSWAFLKCLKNLAHPVNHSGSVILRETLIFISLLELLGRSWLWTCLWSCEIRLRRKYIIAVSLSLRRWSYAKYCLTFLELISRWLRGSLKKWKVEVLLLDLSLTNCCTTNHSFNHYLFESFHLSCFEEFERADCFFTIGLLFRWSAFAIW